MENLRETLRNLIFGAVGLIVFILFLRIIFDIAQIENDFFLRNPINLISDFFAYPFKGIIVINNPNLTLLNTDAAVSLGIYIVLGYLIAKVVTGFMYDTLYDITQNFVDGVFKIAEFIVILRILFQLFGVLPSLRSSAFVDSVFSWTEWTQTLLFRVPFGTGYIDLSAIVWLLILIVLDIFSGRYLAKVLGGTVVIASASTNIIKAPRFKFPTFKRPSNNVTESVENKPKEVYIDLPPIKS